MKENISKKTLSFSCSKKMKYLRTPPDIWDQLKNEFNFTCDMCASDENHLVDKYYTKENSSLPNLKPLLGFSKNLISTLSFL